VCSDRSGKLKLNFLNLNWEKLNIGSELFNKEEIPEKPRCLQDLIDYSEKLSKPFPFVRVDFYIFNDRPIFGELTFTPAGCMASYYNEEGLQLLGDMLALPERYNGQNDKKTNLSIS
jgi:TupA-like ATPgrasp